RAGMAHRGPGHRRPGGVHVLRERRLHARRPPTVRRRRGHVRPARALSGAARRSLHHQWQYADCNTPLVLSFDGAPVEYRIDSAHAFDLNGTRSQVTDWPTARTPWLALDRDGNGRIDDGGELFGSMSSRACSNPRTSTSTRRP